MRQLLWGVLCCVALVAASCADDGGDRAAPAGETDGASTPESIVFAGDGSFYVGHVGGNDDIIHRNAAGTYLDQTNGFADRVGTDWIDLANDQTTMFHTSEGRNINRSNVSTNTQLAAFSVMPGSGQAFALRLLPPGDGTGGLLVADGSRVTPGHAIVEWIDCANLMVDVPVSDAELPLLRRGAKAAIVLEGEPRERQGTVLLTRGSSATLGRVDLAAVAKGREPGVALVLVTLEARGSEFELCPVGRAAYVEFPGIGMIDVLRARLRL